MKNVFFTAALAALAALGVSCDKFLEENPKGSIPQEDFMRSKDDVDKAVYTIYYVLQHQATFGRYWPVIDVGTDDVGTAPTNAGMLNFASHSLSGGQEWFDRSGVWDQWWLGINRCNYVLDGTAELDFDQEYLSQVRAETMCMRAYFYFQLVRAWGDVPIFTWFIRDENISYTRSLDRSSVDEVYDRVIIPDLVYASQYAPSEQAMRGRATKWLAKTILAEVYATRAGWRRDSKTGELVRGEQTNWILARNTAWEVIRQGSECPFKLVTENPDNKYSNAYARIWESDYTDESMLEAGAIGESGLGSWLTRECWTNRRGVGFWGANANAIPFGDGKRLSDMDFTGAANQGKFVPQPDLMHAMEPDDARRWGILTRYDEDGKTYLCQPVFRKYVNFDVALGKAGTSFQYADRNFVIYRYADAMLLFAEADNEVGGPSAESVAAVNAIRNRVGLSDLDAAAVSDQASFRKAIRQERRVEFHGECKRRFDLIRWGEFGNETLDYDTQWLPTDNPKPGGGSYMASPQTLTYVPSFASPGALSPTQAPELVWLLPIPLKELNLNKHWYDNYGY